MAVLLVLNIAIRSNWQVFTPLTFSIFDSLSSIQKKLGMDDLSFMQAISFTLAPNTKTNVLGEMISEPSQVSSWQKERELLNNQLLYWEEIASNHPDYRDAYLAIAQIGYLLNKPDITADNLRKAAMLDPNGQSEKMLESLTR